MTQTIERKAKTSMEQQPLPTTMRAATIDHY